MLIIWIIMGLSLAWLEAFIEAIVDEEFKKVALLVAPVIITLIVLGLVM